MLFIEIALIRWVSTESRIFSYVNNLVLLSCFLGIGMGCYLSSKKSRLYISVAALLILILFIKIPFQVKIDDQNLYLFRDIPLLLSNFSDSLIWGEQNLSSTLWPTVLGMFVTLLIFILIIFVFIPIGQILGKEFDQYKNTITAYSINVTASIFGIWFFALLSFQYIAPFFWMVVVIGLYLVLHYINEHRSVINILMIILSAIMLIVMALLPSEEDKTDITVWSPYQKLEIKPFIDEQTQIDRGYIINVNNIGFMTLLNLSDEFIKSKPNYYSTELRQFCQYDIPYLFAPKAKDVLILGSGGGNDVAGSLRNGVNKIDAVEIDPGIYNLGLNYHPERPYSDPRVNIYIDDARSFMKKSKKSYDVISFGLLDAHILSSNYNNTRIDHYVYTLESFREAGRLLRKNGILTVIFAAQRNWIEKRIYFLLWEVFGTPPLAFRKLNGGNYGWGGTLYVTGWNMNQIKQILDKNQILERYVQAYGLKYSKNVPPVRLTTDNWPYFYLEKAQIPNMHLCLMIILILLFLSAGKYIFREGEKLNLHFFFLGAAFMLIEFQNISKCALLFGSTWLVNGIIITAILILILAANLIVAWYKSINMKIIYFMLMVTIVLSFIISPDVFNSLGYWPKSILAGILLNLPICFAGIIFIRSFQKIKSKSVALGSNLLGAACGGILESFAFMIGIELLIPVTGVLYLLSWYFLNKKPTVTIEQINQVDLSGN